jgi:hypothetical protein
VSSELVAIHVAIQREQQGSIFLLSEEVSVELQSEKAKPHRATPISYTTGGMRWIAI